MADLIDRQAAIEWVNSLMDVQKYYHPHSKSTRFPLEEVIDVLQQVPSAQPEIIRCKDCKYCEHWYKDKGRCFMWHEGGIDVFEEGFCNYAERSEE